MRYLGLELSEPIEMVDYRRECIFCGRLTLCFIGDIGAFCAVPCRQLFQDAQMNAMELKLQDRMREYPYNRQRSDGIRSESTTVY